MHKVVVERPRTRPWHGKKGLRAKGRSFDVLPAKEGMRRPYRDRKHFTDLVGPLRRWLRAQVGRHWNDIYSEACAVIKPDSVVRAHIKTHMLEFVQRHTFLREGRVWCYTERIWRRLGNEMPVEDAATRRSPFYVDPRSGVLREVALAARVRHQWQNGTRYDAEDRRWLSETRALLRVGGLWFDCTMKPFPARIAWDERPHLFDLNGRDLVSRRQAEARYGCYAVCIAKRQLSSRELRHWSLVNAPDPPEKPGLRTRGSSEGRARGGVGFRIHRILTTPGARPSERSANRPAQTVVQFRLETGLGSRVDLCELGSSSRTAVTKLNHEPKSAYEPNICQRR